MPRAVAVTRAHHTAPCRQHTVCGRGRARTCADSTRYTCHAKRMLMATPTDAEMTKEKTMLDRSEDRMMWPCEQHTRRCQPPSASEIRASRISAQ